MERLEPSLIPNGQPPTRPIVEMALEHARGLAAVLPLDRGHDKRFMCLLYLQRQIDLGECALLLFPRRDMYLVGRSMLEGLTQLLWANAEPDRHALWRSFSVVHDWHVWREKQQRGEPTERADEEGIRARLGEHGTEFLTRRGRAALATGTELRAEHFHDTWRRGVKLRDVFESAQALHLYTGVYKRYSNWHHWSVGGLGEALSSRGEDLIYCRDMSCNSRSAAACLEAAFVSLWQTSQVVSVAHELPLDELLRIHAAYVQAASRPSGSAEDVGMQP